MGVKETEGTLVFEVAANATKTEVKQAVRSSLQGEGRRSTHREHSRAKSVAADKFAGYRPDWKKAYVRLKEGEKMPEYAENL